MSKFERYDASIPKGLRLNELAREHDWTGEDFDFAYW